jgi:hypothetical protein
MSVPNHWLMGGWYPWWLIDQFSPLWQSHTQYLPCNFHCNVIMFYYYYCWITGSKYGSFIINFAWFRRQSAIPLYTNICFNYNSLGLFGGKKFGKVEIKKINFIGIKKKGN